MHELLHQTMTNKPENLIKLQALLRKL